MVNLLWVVHNHQPVGNFEFIFERAFDRAYLPFVDVLGKHPNVRLSIHFSGILLDWLVEKRPEYISRLKALVQSGQVEILSGGHYEPILPVLSDADKVGQISKLSATVEKVFGVRPKGMWLAERVWEPNLVASIAKAGIEYVVLDGSHFKMVGKTEPEMNGYFVTEDQGYTLKLFPISDSVRDTIPWRSVGEVIQLLRERNASGEVQIVFGDDGEKFGDWPFTYETVYQNGWLDQFFAAIEAEPLVFSMLPIEAGLKPENDLGLIYLPPASYSEMMMWAQNANDIVAFKQAERALTERPDLPGAGRFLRGTFWRNFFCKYSESNRMHKQGSRLAKQLEALEAGNALSTSEITTIRDHLWQAQCNCGYWHGVFGGLYLPHLRFALYRNLVQASRLMDKALLAGNHKAIWEYADWNTDGHKEYLLDTRQLHLSINDEGEVDQFWLKKTAMNLVDTLTRRREAYHAFVGAVAESGTKLENSLGEKEAGLKDRLVYDQRDRRGFADLFLPFEPDRLVYERQQHHEILSFKAQSGHTRINNQIAELVVKGVATDAKQETQLLVEKKIEVALDGVSIFIQIKFTALDQPLRFSYGHETLFCLLAGNAHDRYVTWQQDGQEQRDILASRGEMPSGSVTLTDEWLKVKARVEAPGAQRNWRDAIETVSQSEGGYERVYQGTVIVPVWDLQLEPGKSQVVEIRVTVQEGV